MMIIYICYGIAASFEMDMRISKGKVAAGPEFCSYIIYTYIYTSNIDNTLCQATSSVGTLTNPDTHLGCLPPPPLPGYVISGDPDQPPAMFCGDAVFVGGCGRFQGDVPSEDAARHVH